jgi:hypothetical protein
VECRRHLTQAYQRGRVRRRAGGVSFRSLIASVVIGAILAQWSFHRNSLKRFWPRRIAPLQYLDIEDKVLSLHSSSLFHVAFTGLEYFEVYFIFVMETLKWWALDFGDVIYRGSLSQDIFAACPERVSQHHRLCSGSNQPLLTHHLGCSPSAQAPSLLYSEKRIIWSPTSRPVVSFRQL